jgi:hypothetical protein
MKNAAKTAGERGSRAPWLRLVRQPVLIFSLTVCLLFWIGESLFHYWVFNHGHPFELIPSDQNELWMRLLICILLVIIGAFAQRQANRKRAIQAEKLRTLKATMHTVEDRVGNSLLSIKYLLLDPHTDQAVDRQTAKQILRLVDDTIGQLREIHTLDRVAERRFGDHSLSFYLDTQQQSGHITPEKNA